ncbi:dimeric dihydrodiol dehydrogenase [Aspergillus japonicus CBS 114.51]|uniref:Dimeric dihydrodiol dehydrogenase n=1 Tax=Aspergillus japonicus CBS 114.51 TaxID=1448312 RepID=A0A8T8WKF0_ASPJA|nr:dimeric dihydrodiol dehydrogenase [Aspergillus japonicus CBS 114.51]RAH76172.1 dimeric dihydrodiol dehydrogenase [Aspergillus japonicus CBS 114.51]
MVRWGILGTGDNATKFVKDLLIDPATRDVHDITHDIAAVASSSAIEKAQNLLSTTNAPPTARAYGSYETLVADPNVEIVYKAFTVNAEQAQVLVDLARKRGLFLMEALWTRFFPLTQHVQCLVREGTIGKVQRIVADRNLGRNVEELYGTEHRLVNPALAGGALLDLAVYPLTWVFLFLSPDQPLVSVPLQTAGSVIKYTETAVDETVTIVLTSPETRTQGVATASLRVTADPKEPGVRILGTRGQIQVFGPAARPDSIKVVVYGTAEDASRTAFPIPVGHGLFWEADECARRVQAGEHESPVMPLEETLLMMRVFDQVREQNGLHYPDEIEAIA